MSATRPLRTGRVLALAAAAVALALAVGWQNFRVRHELCLVLTQAERLAMGRSWHPPPGGVPAVPAVASLAGIPHLLHAGKPGPGHLANSGPALVEAARVARAVEVDIAITRDLVPYLSHDDDFGQLTGTTPARLSARTSVEVEAARLSDGSSPVRLVDFLRRWGAGFDLVVLDVKTFQANAAAKARAIVAALPAEVRPRLRIISLCGPVLSFVRVLAPGIPLGSETYGPLANRAAGFSILPARVSEISDAQDAVARRLGLYRLYWTAATRSEHAAIVARRPEAVIIDLSGADAPTLPAPWRR
jgi:glycerophosphoryl diester phosphodiesterase